MTNYPTEITDEILALHAHISDAEMERDLAENEADIARQIERVEGLALLSKSLPQHRRLSDYLRALLGKRKERDAIGPFADPAPTAPGAATGDCGG